MRLETCVFLVHVCLSAEERHSCVTIKKGIVPPPPKVAAPWFRFFFTSRSPSRKVTSTDTDGYFSLFMSPFVRYVPGVLPSRDGWMDERSGPTAYLHDYLPLQAVKGGWSRGEQKGRCRKRGWNRVLGSTTDAKKSGAAWPYCRTMEM